MLEESQLNTPSDAFNCFMGTELDKLIIEIFILIKIIKIQV